MVPLEPSGHVAKTIFPGVSFDPGVPSTTAVIAATLLFLSVPSAA